MWMENRKMMNREIKQGLHVETALRFYLAENEE